MRTTTPRCELPSQASPVSADRTCVSAFSRGGVGPGVGSAKVGQEDEGRGAATALVLCPQAPILGGGQVREARQLARVRGWAVVPGASALPASLMCLPHAPVVWGCRAAAKKPLENLWGTAVGRGSQRGQAKRSPGPSTVPTPGLPGAA